MSVNEIDLEQLEAYLDDELSSEEAADLDQRLATDSSLREQLTTIRAQRSVRASLWRSMEPSEEEVQPLLNRVDVVLHRQVDWSRRLRALRYIGSAAACLVVGFMISHAVQPNAPHDPILTPKDAPLVQGPTDPAHGPVYQVVLQDDNGGVIGVQNFNSIDDAREFQSDVGQLQNKRHQIQNGIRLITDKF